MRFKIIALIACGIVLALGGAVGTFRYTRALELELATARSSLAAFGNTIAIPVPSADHPRGAVLSPADFRAVRIPESYLPENILRAPPVLEFGETLVALTGLKAGTAIFDTDLAKSGAALRAGLLPVGNGRIFAITPRNLTDFGNALAEGSLVDVIWTRNIGGGKSESRLIATGLRARMPPGETKNTALDGKLLLEGEFPEALRAVVSGQDGFVNILLSDGTRSTSGDTVVIGPTDLERLPLLVREGGVQGQEGSSLLGKITGDAGSRTRCPTAVIRGGSRSVSDVPC